MEGFVLNNNRNNSNGSGAQVVNPITKTLLYTNPESTLAEQARVKSFPLLDDYDNYDYLEIVLKRWWNNATISDNLGNIYVSKEDLDELTNQSDISSETSLVPYRCLLITGWQPGPEYIRLRLDGKNCLKYFSQEDFKGYISNITYSGESIIIAKIYGIKGIVTITL